MRALGSLWGSATTNRAAKKNSAKRANHVPLLRRHSPLAGANYKLEGPETADTRCVNVNRETPNSVSAGMLMHENIKSSPCVLNSLKCSSKTLVVKLA